VYCTTAAGCQPNCSQQIYHILSYISYHVISFIVSYISYIISYHIIYHIISFIISYIISFIISYIISYITSYIISYYIIYHIILCHISYHRHPNDHRKLLFWQQTLYSLPPLPHADYHYISMIQLHVVFCVTCTKVGLEYAEDKINACAVFILFSFSIFLFAEFLWAFSAAPKGISVFSSAWI
jgi:hypothetical protein